MSVDLTSNLKGLYLVAVPIGNPLDISLRACKVLNSVNAVLCEDTRVTGLLFKELDISAKLISYHEHNAEEMRPEIERRLLAGESLALVSDAGTPLISDPGFKLVRYLYDKDIPVTSLPGACAAVNALVLSGLPSNRFFFEGFLPSKESARIQRLEDIKEMPSTLVFYESPRRVGEMLQSCMDVLGDRPVAVIREMTKKYEEVIRGNLSHLIEKNLQLKGEVVVVVGGAEEAEFSDEQIIEALKSEMENKSKKEAVKLVCEKMNLPKKRVYQLSLSL